MTYCMRMASELGSLDLGRADPCEVT